MVVAAGVFLGVALPTTPHTPEWAITAGVFLALTLVFGSFRLKLPFSSQWLSFDVFIISLAQLTFGTPLALLCAGAGAAATSRFLRPGPRFRFVIGSIPAYRVVFNIAACCVSAGVAGLASDWVQAHLILPIGQDIVPAAASWATVYFLVNTFTITGAVALYEQASITNWWKTHCLWTWPGYLASASLAALLLVLWQHFQFFSLLPVPLIYFVHAAYREHMARTEMKEQHIEELSRTIESLMTSLAMAIEAKDVYTREHIQRVQFFAVCLAEAAELEASDRDAVRLGALVHDVGKIAIPERILTKPGKLTPAEFQRMKTHVTIGSMILEPVGFACPVVDAVRSHHERWDGFGYPEGLRGEDIPVGGRVIAIADFFDAMTSDRPYRRALPAEEALELLRREAGSQFDPQLAALFIKIFPDIFRRMPQRGSAASTARKAPSLPDAVYSHIAAAAAEDITAAFDIIETLLGDPEDILERALAHLRNILPSVSAAIFEPNVEGSDLVATTTAGDFAELLHGMVIRVGEGVSGRAARDQCPFLNAAAMPDVARVLDPMEHIELSAALCAPVVVRDQTVAVITLYHTSYDIYQEHHLHVLTTVAGHLASALDLRRRSAQDRALAIQDPRTGLYNLRYLVDSLSARLTHAGAEGSQIALLLIDLDQFKTINDRYGHLAGDEVITAVARKLRDCAQEPAVVCRYGGDEFVILMDGAGRQDAERLTGRVREAIEEISPWDGFRLTCSVGIAVFPEDGRGVKSLIAAADLRMYQDKTRSRTADRSRTRMEMELPSESSTEPLPGLPPFV
jgi:diguanylate cyclase (GGDEF)-like protein/putative nucleotidyltransferase with HDIG domain